MHVNLGVFCLTASAGVDIVSNFTDVLWQAAYFTVECVTLTVVRTTCAKYASNMVKENRQQMQQERPRRVSEVGIAHEYFP